MNTQVYSNSIQFFYFLTGKYENVEGIKKYLILVSTTSVISGDLEKRVLTRVLYNMIERNYELQHLPSVTLISCVPVP